MIWTTAATGMNYILAILKSDNTTFSNSIMYPDGTSGSISLSNTVPAGGVPLLSATVEIFTFNPKTCKISVRCATSSITTAALSITFAPTLTVAGTSPSIVFSVPAGALGFSTFTVSNTSTDCTPTPLILRSVSYLPGSRDFVRTTCGSSTLCVTGSSSGIVSDRRCYTAYGAALTEVSNVCGTRNVDQIKGFTIIRDSNQLTVSWTSVTATVSTLYGGWELVMTGYDFISGAYIVNYKGTTSPQVYTLPSTNFLVFFRVYVHALGCDAYSTFTRAIAAGNTATLTTSGSTLSMSYTPVGASTAIVQQLEASTTVIATTRTVRRRRQLLTQHVWSSSNRRGTRRLDAPSPSIQQLGCFANNGPGYPLTVSLEFDDGQMSFERCRTEALRSNLNVFGLSTETCYLGDVVPTLALSDSSCNRPCPGNPSQICGGASGALSVYIFNVTYFPAVDSYTYSSSPNANIDRSVAIGSGFFVNNAIRLTNGANKYGAVRIPSSSSGNRTFAAVFHITSHQDDSDSDFGFSFNYGPSSDYLAPTSDFRRTFVTGSPGLSVMFIMESKVRFVVRLSGVVIVNTTNAANPLRADEILDDDEAVRYNVHIAERTPGDPRLHVVVSTQRDADYYALSNVSLGSAYQPTSNWQFRLATSTLVAPHTVFLHNMKIWFGASFAIPAQVSGQYTNQGCFLEENFNNVGVEYLVSNFWTIDGCYKLAGQGLFEYFGLTMAGQCFLGRVLPSRPAVMCTHACLAKRSEVCGGWTAFSVYKVDDIPFPSNKVSYMLGVQVDASLPSSQYYGDATAAPLFTSLTIRGGSSSGAVQFPGIVPASQFLLAIFHAVIPRPSPIPSPGTTIGLRLHYALVTVTCTPGPCVALPGLGLTVDFAFDAAAVWTSRVICLGTVIASAPLVSTQFNGLNVTFVKLILSSKISITGLSALLRLEVGQASGSQVVFDDLPVPPGFKPLDSWSFLLEANSTASNFQPRILAFMAMPLASEDLSNWNAGAAAPSDANYVFRTAVSPPPTNSSVQLRTLGVNPLRVYALRFNQNKELLLADIVNYEPIPAPTGLDYQIVSCTAVTVSWNPVDVAGPTYDVIFQDASTQTKLFVVSTTSTSVQQTVSPSITYQVTVQATLFDSFGVPLKSSYNPSVTIKTIDSPFLTSVAYDRSYVGAPYLPFVSVSWATTSTTATYAWALLDAALVPILAQDPTPASTGSTTYSAQVNLAARNTQYFLVVSHGYACGGGLVNVTSTPFPLRIVDLDAAAVAEREVSNITVEQISATSVRISWNPVVGFIGLTPLYRVCTDLLGCTALSQNTSTHVTDLRPGLSFEYLIEVYLNESSQKVKFSQRAIYNTVKFEASNLTLSWPTNTTGTVCWTAASGLPSDVFFSISVEFLSPRLDNGSVDPILIRNISRLERCRNISVPRVSELQIKVWAYFAFDDLFPEYKSNQAILLYYLPTGTVRSPTKIQKNLCVSWSYQPLTGLNFINALEIVNLNTAAVSTIAVASSQPVCSCTFANGVPYTIVLVTTYTTYSPPIVRRGRPIAYTGSTRDRRLS